MVTVIERLSRNAVCHSADYIAWKGQGRKRWKSVSLIVEVLGWGSTRYLQFDWIRGVLVEVLNPGARSKRWNDEIRDHVRSHYDGPRHKKGRKVTR